jgi:hypothetical protein
MLEAILKDREGNGARHWFSIPQSWYDTLDTFHPVHINLQELDYDHFTPTAFYHKLLEGIKQSGLEHPVLDTALAKPLLDWDPFARVLDTLLRHHPQLRVVLLVDEFDVLDELGDRNFHAKLRTVIADRPAVTWIIATALGLYNELTSYESPLFNQFAMLPLRRLEVEEANRLILDPWSPIQGRAITDDPPALQFLPEALDTIRYETGRYPYFIQMLCSAIIAHINGKQHTNYVTASTVHQAIEEITAPNSAADEHFGYLWTHAGGMGKALLLAFQASDEAHSEIQLKQKTLDRLSSLHGDLPKDWLMFQYDRALKRLEAIDALRRRKDNRIVLGIRLLRHSLVGRAGGEALWEDAIRSLNAELKESQRG